MQKTVKWSAATPIKRADNIISSKAREIGDYGFKPSYLSEPSESMKFIMSNEYMRIWFKERSKYEKDTYSREEIIKEESKIKRRFVQRMMTYRRPDKNFFLDEKVEKLYKKCETVEPINYSKYKYKPKCLQVTNNIKPKQKGTNKAGGQMSNNNEDEECNDSKNTEKNPTVIVCNVDPKCCVPCQGST